MLLPDPVWPAVILTVAVVVDALVSTKPPAFVRDCYLGVGFPKEWWWTLAAIKYTAVTGLIVGFWVPGVGAAANVGVVLYFVCAAIAHIRARFVQRSFWLNCLGFLFVATAALLLSYWPF